MRSWLQPILLLLVALLLVLLFSGEIRDTDIFWHLRTGQYIFETHSLPIPDPFSYVSTPPAYPGEEITRRFNLTHEWLSQVIMYLIDSGAGFPGLVTARVLLLLAFCGLAGWIAFRRTRDFFLSLAVVLGAAAMSFYFAQSRPFLATFVFLALTMVILETRRILWLLPPLFLVWANCHSGFILGWVMCSMYGLGALVDKFRGQPQTGASRLWVVMALSVLASLLNPNGFRVLQVLMYYRSSGIQTSNLEWQRPIFWTPGIYSFLLFGSLLALLAARRKARTVDWLLYIAFGAISLLAVRNTIFMGLVGPVLIASYLPEWRRLRPYVSVAAVALGIAGLLAYDVPPAVAAGNALAFRAATWQLPSGAAAFIQQHHITARMFNNYEAGGYYIWRLWPLQRVFVDGRGLSETAFADYRKILYDTTGGRTAADLLNRYAIDMVAIEGFDYLSGQVYPVAVNLANAPGGTWTLAYVDEKGLVFLRHPLPDSPALNPQRALLESLAAQCEEHVRRDPLRPRCAFGLGELYAFRGDPEHARQWISFYLQHRTGPDPEADAVYQSLTVTDLNKQAAALQAKGDLQAAEGLLRKSVAIAQASLGAEHPDTAGALNNLATVLEAENKYPEAELLFRRALEISGKKFGPSNPHTAMALDNLAGVLEAQGDLANAEILFRRALSIVEHSLGPDDPASRTIRDDLDELVKARQSRPGAR